MKKAFTGVLFLAALAPACSSDQSPDTSTPGGGTSGTGTGGAAGSVSGGTAGSLGGGTAGSVSGGTSGAVSGGSAGVSSGGTGMVAGTGGQAGTSAGAGGSGNESGGGSSGVAGSAGTGTGGAGTGGAGTGGGGTAGDSGGGGVAGTSGSGGVAGSSAGMAGAGGVTCQVPTGAPSAQLITFNDNGGWCWYQDERVVVDTANNRLVVGSIGSGGNRTGNVEAVVYDLAQKTGQRTVLNTLSVDDHNAPGFVITGSGTVAAMWATHRENCNSYFSVLSGSTWAATKTYSWTPNGCPWAGASTNMITYANPWRMSAESNRLLSFVRSVDTSPASLTSTDNGGSWNFYGRLTASPQTGYVAGYYKYWGNGVDRIDWVGTEAHPRDEDNSLWHGYVQGGKVYNSTGTVVDDTLSDGTAKDVSAFTSVFKTGTMLNGVALNHMWNHDIVRYGDGTIAVLGQGRVAGTGSDDPDKRMFYSRFDGTKWTTTYLVKAGTKLYDSEQDYTGLSALDPDNPTIIYVSTPYDPRNDSTMTSNGKREIWQGTTCDQGKTFTWTPITQNSTVDNIRPVVPKWDASHTALLWMQGTYTSAQSFNMKIVGLLL